MNEPLMNESYDEQTLYEASLLILEGQPFEAHAVLEAGGMLDTALGRELLSQLPRYEETLPRLDAFDQAVANEDHAAAHEISKELPDLIYPENLEVQRVAVAILMEDEAMTASLLERLPENHAFRLQLRFMENRERPTRSSKAAWATGLAAATLVLFAGGWGYMSHQDEKELSSKLATVEQQKRQTVSQKEAQTKELEQLKSELAASKEALVSSEAKWNEDRKKLQAQLEQTTSTTGQEMSGLQAYASGDYETAARLLGEMQPVGEYNAETIAFYRLMALYKGGATSNEALNQFETAYPNSDYLGDVYFSYLVTLKDKTSYDQLKQVIKERFPDDWFIPVM